MIPNSNLSLGLEAIDFQSDSFFDDIEEWVRAVRENSELHDILRSVEDNNAFDELERRLNNREIAKLRKTIADQLSVLIKKRTNIKATVDILPDNYLEDSLFCSALVANRNSAQRDPHGFHGHSSSKEFRARYEEISKRKPGWMDRRKVKVYGFYEDVEFKLYVPLYFIHNPDFSTHEVAAGILHEIGHKWRALEVMSITYSYVQGMTELHQLFTTNQDFSERKISLEYLSNKEDKLLKDYDLDELAKLDPDGVSKVVITERMLRVRSQSGATASETKSDENHADVFAARFGGGKHVATLVDKIGHKAWDLKTQSKLMHYSIQTINLFILGSLATMPVLGWFVSGVLLWTVSIDAYGSTKSRYEELPERLEKLRQQTVVQMKGRNLTKEKREALQAEFNCITGLIDDMKKNYSVMAVVSRLFILSPTTGRLRKAELINHLERMGNNKLFAIASRVETLS